MRRLTRRDSHDADSNAPTWDNMLNGQINMRDAVRCVFTFSTCLLRSALTGQPHHCRKDISLETGGKSYKLNPEHAVLLVRCVPSYLK